MVIPTSKPLRERAAFAGVVVILQVVFIALFLALAEYDPKTLGPKTKDRQQPAPGFE